MRMIKKKLIAVCLSMMLLEGVTGCTKTVESSQTQESSDRVLSHQTQEDTSKEPENTITQEKQDNEIGSEIGDNVVQTEESGGKQEDASAQNEIGFQDGTEFLSGKIQSVEEDSMIIAQTTILEDGMVTLVDEKDAKKISVKFIEDTKVEHWTIKGGGADIDRKDAALSDLTVGMGVEMEGYYESKVFVAIRVLIEEYV